MALIASLSSLLVACHRVGQKPPPSVDLPVQFAPALALSAVPKPGDTFSVRTSKIFDGDSFEFEHAGQRYGVRLAGVDAPEKGQPHAEDSRKTLQGLIRGQDIELSVQKIDPYQRLVSQAQVLHEGKRADLGLLLIEAGAAWYFKRYGKEQPAEQRLAYIRAEQQARDAKAGLWGKDEPPMAPWDFRDQLRKERRTVSYNTTPQATDTFKLSTWPNIGIRTN